MSPRHQDNLVAISLHLVAVVVLCLFSVSPALGQNTYSDVWFDDSGMDYEREYNDGEAIYGAYVVGCGVTDGSYTHSYYVDTVEKGPTGSTASGSSGRRVGYARRDLSLSWDWTGEGGYFTEDTEHWARCPGDDLNYYSIGTTFNLLLPGLSKMCYEQKDQDILYAYYDPVGQCKLSTTCYPPTTDMLRYPTSQYVLRTELWYSYDDGYTKYCTGKRVKIKMFGRHCGDLCGDYPRNPRPPLP